MLFHGSRPMVPASTYKMHKINNDHLGSFSTAWLETMAGVGASLLPIDNVVSFLICQKKAAV